MLSCMSLYVLTETSRVTGATTWAGFGQLSALYSSEELPFMCLRVQCEWCQDFGDLGWREHQSFWDTSLGGLLMAFILSTLVLPLCASKNSKTGNARHYNLTPMQLSQLSPSNQTWSSAVAGESFRSLILEVRSHPSGWCCFTANLFQWHFSLWALQLISLPSVYTSVAKEQQSLS